MPPVHTLALSLLTMALVSQVDATAASTSPLPTLEVVKLATKAEYTPEQVVEAAGNVTKVLQGYPGFISRTFSQQVNDDGVKSPTQWIDIVHWTNITAAVNAAKHIISTPEMKAFAATMESFDLQHYEAQFVTS